MSLTHVLLILTLLLPSCTQNILLHGSGHVLLTDFDLSYSKGVTTPKIEKVMSKVPKKVGS